MMIFSIEDVVKVIVSSTTPGAVLSATTAFLVSTIKVALSTLLKFMAPLGA